MARALQFETDPVKQAELINKNAFETSSDAKFEVLESLEYAWSSEFFAAQKDLLEMMKQRYQGIQVVTKK